MPSPEVIQLAKAVSRLFGWIYTISWSLSFYPQLLLNIRRRSTTGCTISFPVINFLGFSAYAISTGSFFYSPLIQAQYAARNPESPETTVRGNDVAFAVHSVFLCMVTWSTFSTRLWGFEQDTARRGKWRVGKVVLGIIAGCLVGVASTVGLVLFKGIDGGRDPKGWAWIDVVYALGFVKLLITTVKYIPQVWRNYQRKSTVGWSISPILMDVLGAVLSISQLMIDSSLQNDWSGLTGNPVKLGLGNVSIIFDIIFITQHYKLYHGARKGEEKALGEESGGLLESHEEDTDGR